MLTATGESFRSPHRRPGCGVAWHHRRCCSSVSAENGSELYEQICAPYSHGHFPAPEFGPGPIDLPPSTCSPVPHLQFGKGLLLEELLHPELKIEAKAVEDRPDVNNLAGPQPQGGDGKGGDGGHELLHDVVMVLSNVIVHVPNGQGKWSVLPIVKETPPESLTPRSPTTSSSQAGQSRAPQ